MGSSGRRERDHQFAFGRGENSVSWQLGQLGRLFGPSCPNGILTLPIGWWRSWKRTSLVDSPRMRTRPAQHQPEDFELGATRGGWQHGQFSRCPVLPHIDFFFFWAALLQMSVFFPTRNFQQFWADALFWPKRKPKMLKFCPTHNFGHFWAAVLKMSGFTPC